MPIIIPSKKIYEIDNPKILDNIVSSAEVAILNAEEKQESEKLIIRESRECSYVMGEDFFESDTNITTPSYVSSENAYGTESSGAGKTMHSVSYSKLTPIYNEFEISFVRNRNYTSFIDDKITLSYSKSVERVTRNASITFKYGSLVTVSGVYTSFYASQFSLSNPSSIVEEKDFRLPTSITYRVSALESKSEFQDETTQKVTMSYDDDIKMYTAKIKVLVGCWALTGGGNEEIGNGYLDTGYTFNKDGTMIEYRPKSVVISAFGNEYTLDLSENKFKIPEDSEDTKSQIAISRNDFLQFSYKDNIKSNIENIIENYNNGKEVATILCSVGEYYDKNGNKVISTQTADKMTFNLYDEVVPMINSPLNFDVPMSLTDDLMPKTFAVLGSKINFDGAVWQTLYLQEKGKLENTYFLNGSDNIIYEPSQDFSEFICSGVKNDNTIENAIIASNVNGLSVTSIKNNAFENNNTLKSITIPEKIEYIGDYAFANCLINGIKLPTTIKQIGASAFENCTNFKNIVLQNKIEFIGQSAFKNTHLFDFAMPNDLQSIESYSFSQTPLKAISIGKNVKYIADGAFSNCTDLKTIVVSPSTISIAENAFEGTNANINIIIQGEQGEIQGAPWGATGNVNIHYLPKDIKGEYAVFCNTDINREKHLYFNIKGYGKGKVYVNNELVFEEDLTDNSKFYYAYNGYALVSFEGNFTEISPEDTEVSANEFRNYQNILAILKWNNTELYKNMFRRNDFTNVPIEIPSNYSVLPEGCFEKTKLYRLTIPQNIKKIDYNALAFEYCVELIFLHDKNDFITLDKEIAYSKYARQINIYTDNTIIKNYDWSGNNINATFYHIDGSEWK